MSNVSPFLAFMLVPINKVLKNIVTGILYFFNIEYAFKKLSRYPSSKVIVMVLVVNFFQRVLHTEFATPLEMLYFALSIAALAIGLYFLGMVGKKDKKTEEKEEVK